ncbi:MAG: hypothetical protein QMD96_01900 [Anaerosomatales bacterium]|nr:hypothetical protein [Anaerosomatales bacterium]
MRIRGSIMKDAMLAVAIVVLAKLAAHAAGIEFLDQNALLTSLIAAAFFVFGLILAGTISDYKESDKMVSEFVSAAESVMAEAKATERKNPEYDSRAVARLLGSVMSSFREGVSTDDYEPLRRAIADLSPAFDEMEVYGALPQYVSRLRADQATMMRVALRTAHLQRVDFLPSAHVLLVTVAWLVILILVFTAIEPLHMSVVLSGFVAFVFSYMLRLRRTLERPFHRAGETRDDVSLFLLKACEARLQEHASGLSETP